jgi:H+/Cl- antiporter ClcA
MLMSATYAGFGNPLGIEAPTLHVCAALGSSLHVLMCRLLNSKLVSRLTGVVHLGHTFFPVEALVHTVVIAVSAGISSNFNTVLGAVVYALEENGLSGEPASTVLISISAG